MRADATDDGLRVWLDDGVWLDVPVENPVYRRLLDSAEGR